MHVYDNKCMFKLIKLKILTLWFSCGHSNSIETQKYMIIKSELGKKIVCAGNTH